MTQIEELFKNLAMTGIGAVAIGYEKAQKIVNELIKRGEMTVEEGKVFNAELQKRLRKEPMKAEDVDLDAMSPEERAELLRKLRAREEAE
jgi:polyhydroxyalkanoate synthesis regulator phasin